MNLLFPLLFLTPLEEFSRCEVYAGSQRNNIRAHRYVCHLEELGGWCWVTSGFASLCTQLHPLHYMFRYEDLVTAAPLATDWLIKNLGSSSCCKFSIFFSFADTHHSSVLTHKDKKLKTKIRLLLGTFFYTGIRFVFP